MAQFTPEVISDMMSLFYQGWSPAEIVEAYRPYSRSRIIQLCEAWPNTDERKAARYHRRLEQSQKRARTAIVRQERRARKRLREEAERSETISAGQGLWKGAPDEDAIRASYDGKLYNKQGERR